MKVYGYRENALHQQVLTEIYDIHEATYSGKDMGERKIDAIIKSESPIDFKIGDYIELQIADLQGHDDAFEKFYIQTMPTIKKTASSGSVGDAFETTVSFYPAQYELSVVQMRDCVQEQTAESLQYTGYDEFSFYGGAHTLMRRIIYVLNERFANEPGVGTGKPDGNPTAQEMASTYTGWNYFIAESVDEEINKSLESFQFDFSGNTVMDALMKLNEEEGVNTEFFINGRTIYVGYKKSYICQVTGTTHNTVPFRFEYGKSSHLKDVPNSTYTEKGGLYDITKTMGSESPITKLFAYGANKNLNRFYCSDRLASGRYAAQLMLPSFARDGKTDYILASDEAISKFGIREGSKRWEDIYPTVRYITYGSLRKIKYVIRVENSGLIGANGDPTTNRATIRCYKVVPSSNGSGVNKLEPAWPQKTLAVFVHATGKTIKCVLQGHPNSSTAAANQIAQDGQGNVPVNSQGQQITGACFCVHMLHLDGRQNPGYADGQSSHKCLSRSQWFTNLDSATGLSTEEKTEIEMHQIQYTDDYWGTDCFAMQYEDNQPMYDEQTIFIHDDLSFGCYPVINDNYSIVNPGSAFRNDPNTQINEVVDIQPVTVDDTDLNEDQRSGQNYFYVYMRDIGFKVNQQAYSGQYNWLLQGNFTIEFLDGKMGGKAFTVDNDKDAGSNIVCLYNEDGTTNDKWDSTTNDPDLDASIAARAKANGAIWRFKCNRNTENDKQWLPMKNLNPVAGNHVVFTNIYMPDIYIYAAQDRLLREAQKYLNDNDNGDVSYSLTMDAVRMAQQAELGRQMREGAIMRIVDNDLQIYTDNEKQILYSSEIGVWASGDIPQTVSAKTYIKVPYFIPFRGNKHYKLTLDVGLLASVVQKPDVLLYDSLTEGSTYFAPDDIEIETEENVRDWETDRMTIEFDLPSSFNENKDYAIGVAFANYSEETSKQNVYLLEVEESNLSGSDVIKYVDLTIDQLTIKLTDSERSYDPTPSVRRSGGSHSTTGKVNKQIQASVKQKSKASAWGQLMSKINDTAIQSQMNVKTAEENAAIARRNYRFLEMLKNTIFDPDGNVNEVFFHTMMLQNGADSMNYVMDKTYVANGIAHNINLSKNNNGWSISFGFDKLRHYVFTNNAGGTWNISNKVFNNGSQVDSLALDYDKTYYISIKCNKSGTSGDWYVSTNQMHSEETNFTSDYFFNFGVIMPCATAQETTRMIMETRGNVFIYGENVVLGRIATQDGSSYLDMMRAEFNLGNGLLKFENGTLTINGSAKIGDSNKTILNMLDAYGYLTAALHQGTTAIGGGIVLTQNLLLKDSNDTDVTAGMSGNTDKDMLLWGGGTYSEAEYASGHDYAKSSGGEPITTLLKKDGTGKIGIFRIGNNNVRVVVPGQGYIDIDVSTGIKILDSNQREKVVISPKSLIDDIIAKCVANDDHYLNYSTLSLTWAHDTIAFEKFTLPSSSVSYNVESDLRTFTFKIQINNAVLVCCKFVYRIDFYDFDHARKISGPTQWQTYENESAQNYYEITSSLISQLNIPYTLPSGTYGFRITFDRNNSTVTTLDSMLNRVTRSLQQIADEGGRWVYWFGYRLNSLDNTFVAMTFANVSTKECINIYNNGVVIANKAGNFFRVSTSESSGLRIQTYGIPETVTSVSQLYKATVDNKKVLCIGNDDSSNLPSSQEYYVEIN